MSSDLNISNQARHETNRSHICVNYCLQNMRVVPNEKTKTISLKHLFIIRKS
jgi:hypothetical protein